MTQTPMTRREFIRGTGSLGFLAFSGVAPAFLTQSARAQAPKAERDRSIFVIIQLAGGNDGLNTVIPFSDDRYYNLRPKIGIKNNFWKLDEHLALHPSCEALYKLYDQGNLSIIQNVGYPNPNRSHFRSTEIWETASEGNTYKNDGWLGRYFDNSCSGSAEDSVDPTAIHISDMVPQTYLSEQPHSIFGMRSRGRFGSKDDPADKAFAQLLEADHIEGNASYLQHTMMDTLVTERRVEEHIAKYKPSTKYPGTGIGQSLKRIAALIHANMETRVYYVSQGGYDTHANQLNRQAQLLKELSQAMAAFQKDLTKNKKDDQVLTMTFSEFGRRPAENGSNGTDHGTAAPLFVMGGATKGGIIGDPPDLNVTAKQDLTYSTDFRGIYASVLDNWLQTDSETVLGEKFASVPFI